MLVQPKTTLRKEKFLGRAHRLRSAAVSAAMLAALTACGQHASLVPHQPEPQPGESLEAQASFTAFPDLPIPNGAEMDIERTFVFGGEDGWYGQTVIQSDGTANQMFDFFKAHLPDMGWREVTSVRAKTSVLTYIRDPRVLAIQISSASLRGAEALVTVSPAQGGV